MDQIFTPPELGRALLALAGRHTVDCVADFAVGDGALLALAAEKWPSAAFVGCDVDNEPLASARKRLQKPSLTRCDFLDDGTRSQNKILKRAHGQVSLVLLNPPFSGRGLRTFPSEVNGTSTRSGKAIAFVARALEYLDDDGLLLAILPSSCFTSQRDEHAMQLIRRWYSVERVGPARHQQFRGHTVGINLVRIKRRAQARAAVAAASSQSFARIFPFGVIIARGSHYAATMTPVRQGIEFVHTTHLANNKVSATLPKAAPRSRERVFSRGVVIPRVGRPDQRKVCRLTARKKVIPSDCLFILQTKPAGHESELQRILLDNWSKLKRSYSGSCAPYLTTRKLAAVLEVLQLDVVVRSRAYKPNS